MSSDDNSNRFDDCTEKINKYCFIVADTINRTYVDAIDIDN